MSYKAITLNCYIVYFNGGAMLLSESQKSVYITQELPFDDTDVMFIG